MQSRVNFIVIYNTKYYLLYSFTLSRPYSKVRRGGLSVLLLRSPRTIQFSKRLRVEWRNSTPLFVHQGGKMKATHSSNVALQLEAVPLCHNTDGFLLTVFTSINNNL